MLLQWNDRFYDFFLVAFDVGQSHKTKGFPNKEQPDFQPYFSQYLGLGAERTVQQTSIALPLNDNLCRNDVILVNA